MILIDRTRAPGYDARMNTGGLSILAVNIGSTRVAAGVLDEHEIRDLGYTPAADPAATAARIAELARTIEPGAGAVAIATVNPPAAAAIRASLDAAIGGSIGVYTLGVDIPIPQSHTLGERHTTGQDRLLNALAAFDMTREACAVIDAGTAVTVDFVDGAGVFHGGAIAPGAGMQLNSLHSGTATLPEVDFAVPDPAEVFAKTTREAMLHGVYFGVRGMVRLLVERYAESFGAYPRIIATGGDAMTLFEDDEFVERVVPELTLRGVGVAVRAALDEDE